MNVLAVIDDVTQVDAHPKIKTAAGQIPLHGNGAADGVLDRLEFSQETVTGVFDDAPGMFLYTGINHG